MRALLAALLLTPCICAFASDAEQTRGVTVATAQNEVKVVTAENEVVRLYSGSYAMLVGNSDYAQWPRLHWPALDVDEIASVLGNLGFKTYVHKNLSASGFRAAMAEFIRAHGKDSQAQLLIYYAGHGHTELGAGGRRLGYIAMTDTPDPHRPDFLAKAVGLDDFQSYAYTVTARHVLFVFDSCFAGSVMRSYEMPRSLNKYVTLPAREFLTAGDADEPVPDRSYFKTILVQVLQGVIQEPVPDGYLTAEEIGVLMKSVIPSISKSQHPQYSKIGDPALNKGDFVFVLSKGASPPLQPVDTKPRYQNEGTLWLAKDLYTRGSHARAIEEFRKAAGLDSAEAMTFLGYMLFRGQGVPADTEAARRWFEKAAALGNTSAMNNLGFMYGPGGVPPLDVAKARSWLSRAAERGDVCAAYNLGMLYLRDGASAEDRSRGLELLRRAAQAGYGEAMNNLAYHLAAARDGEGAVRWYEEAASSGETSALFNLGFLYYEGKVVARDYSKAHQLFARGAQTGHPGAMNSLGWMCMNGQGVGRDYAAAARWFEQASRAGNAAAANNLGALWESGKLGKKDLRTALDWYRTSANEGNPGGLLNLARFYDQGLVVPSNRREAIRLYGEAARLGELQAAERLRQIQGQP